MDVADEGINKGMETAEKGGDMAKEGAEKAGDMAGKDDEEKGDDGKGDADKQSVFQRMEMGINNLFHDAKKYLGYSFIQMKSRATTQYCACHNGQVIQYA